MMLNTRSPRPRRRSAARTKQEVVTQWRRGEILQAARRIVAKRGLAGATVDAVAAEAGVAKGTVYLYFRSKDDLYRALLDHAVSELHARTSEALERAEGAEAKVRAVIAARLEYFDEHREFFRIYHFANGDLLRTHQRVQSEFRERTLAQVRALARALEEAARRGEVRPLKAERIAFILHDVTKGIVVSRLLDPAPPPLSEEIETLADLAWNGLKP